MRQQINLYQPMFREQRKLFSAATVAIALGAVLVGLVGIWSFAAWQISGLQKEIALVRAQRDSQVRLTEAVGVMQAKRGNPQQLNASIKSLRAELARATQAVQILRRGDAGEVGGFAERLEAFAHQHVDGLWLEHIVLASRSQGIRISGRSMDPQSVPQYLQQLSAEPALAGTRVDRLAIESNADPAQKSERGLSFTASSRALEPKKDGERT